MEGTAQLGRNKGAFSARPALCFVRPGSELALGALLMSSSACHGRQQTLLIGHCHFLCTAGSPRHTCHLLCHY